MAENTQEDSDGQPTTGDTSHWSDDLIPDISYEGEGADRAGYIKTNLGLIDAYTTFCGKPLPRRADRPTPQGDMLVRCPAQWHEDTEPSASLNPGKGVWVCFSCGAKGDVLSLIGASRLGLTHEQLVADNTAFREVVRIGLEFLGNPSEEEILALSGTRPLLAGRPEPVDRERNAERIMACFLDWVVATNRTPYRIGEILDLFQTHRVLMMMEFALQDYEADRAEVGAFLVPLHMLETNANGERMVPGWKYDGRHIPPGVLEHDDLHTNIFTKRLPVAEQADGVFDEVLKLRDMDFRPDTEAYRHMIARHDPESKLLDLADDVLYTDLFLDPAFWEVMWQGGRPSLRGDGVPYQTKEQALAERAVFEDTFLMAVTGWYEDFDEAVTRAGIRAEEITSIMPDPPMAEDYAPSTPEIEEEGELELGERPDGFRQGPPTTTFGAALEAGHLVPLPREGPTTIDIDALSGAAGKSRILDCLNVCMMQMPDTVPEYHLMCLLASASGLVGYRVGTLSPGYSSTSYPRVWPMLIGETAAGKSTVMSAWRSATAEALDKLQSWPDRVDNLLFDMRHTKTFHNLAASGEGLLHSLRRVLPPDTDEETGATVEEEVPNSRSIFFVDEISGEIRKASGSATSTMRTVLLQLGTAKKDEVISAGFALTRGDLEVTGPHVILAAGIQPVLLEEVLSTSDLAGGLINRMFPTYGSPLFERSPYYTPSYDMAALSDVLTDLTVVGYKLASAGSCTLGFTEDAMQMYADWFIELKDELARKRSPLARNILSRRIEMMSRILPILVLDRLAADLGPEADSDTLQAASPVTVRDVQMMMVIEKWFTASLTALNAPAERKAAAEVVFSKMGTSAIEEAIEDYMMQRRTEFVPRRDIIKIIKKKFKQMVGSDQVDRTIQSMLRAGMLEARPKGKTFEYRYADH